ncbi:hypothetical protein VTK73DRAFT_2131 [Phialemonium thermophilum]|uniref:Secreted protein n=1 Tax=Phialemonium thermophilum TaxID=223376 RepID=A0ABR3VSI1_9PEZI
MLGMQLAVILWSWGPVLRAATTRGLLVCSSLWQGQARGSRRAHPIGLPYVTVRRVLWFPAAVDAHTWLQHLSSRLVILSHVLGLLPPSGQHSLRTLHMRVFFSPSNGSARGCIRRAARWGCPMVVVLGSNQEQFAWGSDGFTSRCRRIQAVAPPIGIQMTNGPWEIGTSCRLGCAAASMLLRAEACQGWHPKSQK